MHPIVSAKDLYNAAVERKPIYVRYGEDVYGPGIIEELTKDFVRLRIESSSDFFARSECSFYTD